MPHAKYLWNTALYLLLNDNCVYALSNIITHGFKDLTKYYTFFPLSNKSFSNIATLVCFDTPYTNPQADKR